MGSSVACCTRQQEQLHVLHIANPEYPTAALVNNFQGTVHVDILIGADGKVMAARALTTAYPTLAEAAEKNVRQWEFGPFPPEATFPIRHIITYVFTLKGPALSVRYLPTVRTHLPDEVEIESRPFKDDLGYWKLVSPAEGAKPPRKAK
jgi:TonB family protein